MSCYSKELETLKIALKEAGTEILKIYYEEFKTQTKEDNTPVTIADLKADEILINHLSKFNYPIISEETDSKYSNEEHIWIIDPLDGTRDFIQKTDDFSIMVALIKNNKPVLGAIYLPVKNYLYYAEINKGTYLETPYKSSKIKVDSDSNINKSTILLSRNTTKEIEFKITEELNIKNIDRRGSIGIKLGEIASGNAHIYFNTSSKLGEWDLCAPQIILEEAGGIVTDKEGDEIKYNTKERKIKNGAIATNNKENHQILIEKIKEHF